MSIPNHVVIIPDGNRRWALKAGLKAFAGHSKGIAAFKDVANQAVRREIRHLSLWGMSIDNFNKRSKLEVEGLMMIFKEQFKMLTTDKDVHDKKIKISVLGRWNELFPEDVKKPIHEAIESTKNYGDYNFNFFLAYNGTDDVLAAISGIVKENLDDEKTEVTGELFKSHLMTKDLPSVDLMIRTGGDPHLSTGFMMWDMADAELYFTETLWPDFGEKEFDDALDEYSARKRLFGK